jgi:hypothetical protein
VLIISVDDEAVLLSNADRFDSFFIVGVEFPLSFISLLLVELFVVELLAVIVSISSEHKPKTLLPISRVIIEALFERAFVKAE